MIRAHLDAAAVGRIRWAPSPVYETVGWLTLAAAGGRHPFWGGSEAATRSVLADPDVAATAAVMSGGLHGRYMPDFVTPKPEIGGSAEEVFRQQLEQVAATPTEVVAEQLALLEPGRRPVRNGQALPLRVASGLATFWRYVVRDRWPRYSAVFAQNRDAQLSLAGTVGIGAVLASLHPSLRWTGGCLEVDKPYEEEVAMAGAELVLMPSLVAWPRLAVQLCNPADATVAYPVAAAPGRVGRSVDSLLGRGRARVLAGTSRPVSTTELSRRLGVSPSTVSHHLGVLHGAGLVDRVRQGRQVLYRRTEVGRRLLDTNA